MIPHVVRPLEPWTGRPTPADARGRSPFKATWTATLDLLDRELNFLNAPQHKPWVLQMDVSEAQIRNDGGVYARATPASPAIKVAFESKHGPLVYQCDRFDRWQSNVRGVALALEALRKVARYGVGSAGEHYRGFTAISNRPAEMSRDQAAKFIAHWAKVGPGTVVLDLRRAYLLAAKRAHPDVTGDDGDTMARLNAARDLLMRPNQSSGS